METCVQILGQVGNREPATQPHEIEPLKGKVRAAEPAGGNNPVVGFIGHSVEIGITVGVLQRLPDPSENLGDVSAGRITKLPCNERAISVTRLRAADGSCSGIGHAMTDALVEKAWVVGVDRAQSENGLGKNGMPVDRLHSAPFEKGFVSLDVASAQIGRRLCCGVLAQICEKPEVGT